MFIDQIKAETKGDKTYYNASFAKVTPEFNLNRDNGGRVYDDPRGGTAPNTVDLFGGNDTVDIPDEQLPF